MKKILALTFAFILLLSSVCMATYQPDPNRWTWMTSTDTVSFYYDKQTRVYYDYGDRCRVWSLVVDYSKEEYTKALEEYCRQDRTIALLHLAIYDLRTDKLINSFDLPPKYQVIIPGSIGEDKYKTMFP